MDRTLDIIIDKNTWPKKATHPQFPNGFQAGNSTYDLNIPSMLWMIGYLTTPTLSTGVSLSEFWAWVRYFAAITNDDDLRLTDSFTSLDAHQKTILSDDFGMGVPLVWLTDKLGLEQVVDGRYFLDKYADRIGASGIKTKKRGPNKTPDFVARDANNQWHVIECKGTQSGEDYRDKQLGINGSIPTGSGGITQKNSILFPPNYTGQRLACGLCINSDKDFKASLKIVDPEPIEPIEINDHGLIYALDTINRGTLSKFLRIAGYETTAEVIASPSGKNIDITQHIHKMDELEHQEFIFERNSRAINELKNKNFNYKNREFIGMSRSFILPRALMIDNKNIKTVTITQSINSDLIDILQKGPTFDAPIQDDHSDLLKLMGKGKMESDELSTKIKFGEIFSAEINLK